MSVPVSWKSCCKSASLPPILKVSLRLVGAGEVATGAGAGAGACGICWGADPGCTGACACMDGCPCIGAAKAMPCTGPGMGPFPTPALGKCCGHIAGAMPAYGMPCTALCCGGSPYMGGDAREGDWPCGPGGMG